MEFLLSLLNTAARVIIIKCIVDEVSFPCVTDHWLLLLSGEPNCPEFLFQSDTGFAFVLSSRLLAPKVRD